METLNTIQTDPTQYKTPHFFWKKIGYALGDFSYNFVWTLPASFLMFFYTDVFLVPAAAVSVLLLVIRIADSLFDPVIGALCDRTDTRWGRYRPWVLIAFYVMSAVSVIMFCGQPDWPLTLKIVFIAVTYFIAGLSSGATNMPYGALNGVQTQNPDERAGFAAFRLGFAMTGGLLITFIFLKMVNAFGNGNMSKGYIIAVTVCAVVGCIGMSICVKSTKEVIKLPPPAKLDWGKEFSKAFHNKPLMLIACSFFVFGLVLYGRMGIMVYYFQYVVGDAGLFGGFYAITTAIGLIGNFGGEPIARKLKNKATLGVWSCAIMAVGYAAMFFFPYTSHIILFYVFGSIGAIGQGLFFTAAYGMLPDCAEYTQWKFGGRSDAFNNSFTSILMKWGGAIAPAAMTGILATLNYVPNVDQPDNIKLAISVMMCLVPGILCAINIIPLANYKLDRKTFYKIVEEIHARES